MGALYTLFVRPPVQCSERAVVLLPLLNPLIRLQLSAAFTIQPNKKINHTHTHAMLGFFVTPNTHPGSEPHSSGDRFASVWDRNRQTRDTQTQACVLASPEMKIFQIQFITSPILPPSPTAALWPIPRAAVDCLIALQPVQVSPCVNTRSTAALC